MEWININTTLPETDKRVLVWVSDGWECCDFGFYNPDREEFGGWVTELSNTCFNIIEWWCELPNNPL